MSAGALWGGLLCLHMLRSTLQYRLIWEFLVINLHNSFLRSFLFPRYIQIVGNVDIVIETTWIQSFVVGIVIEKETECSSWKVI